MIKTSSHRFIGYIIAQYDPATLLARCRLLSPHVLRTLCIRAAVQHLLDHRYIGRFRIKRGLADYVRGVDSKEKVQVKKPHRQENVDVSRIRNIGIMAHIDAGKTTTTERMLYYSGFTRHLGDVDDGDTVTDFLAQERERGITISSAAVTFSWNKHRINLIDTPGHVDFTLEVERCLRVLDGAVAILDASAGVEAQTLTVWRQADRYQVPRIIYLNKMDKNSADFYASLESVSEKLSTIPLVIHLPIGTGSKFTGVVDLVTMTKYLWNRNDPHDDGKEYYTQQLETSEDAVLYNNAVAARALLVERLADVDATFGDEFLAHDDVTTIHPAAIIAALRRAVTSQQAVAVLCGSSLRNCAVQLLMDAIVQFLPDPVERSAQAHPFVRHYGDSLCALAFKTVHDRQRGALTFVRLYSGSLDAGSSVYNVGKECSEHCSKLYQVFADEHREIASVTVGNIAAVSGLKETSTGDTLVSSQRCVASAVKSYQSSCPEGDDGSATVPVLAGMDIPDPVFFCSVEPPSLAFQKALDHALDCLLREDPSLRISFDSDTGQTILGGMGELHLEVIKDRILKEYGIEAYYGPLQIAYRESVTGTAMESASLEKRIGDTMHSVVVSLSVKPSSDIKWKTETVKRGQKFHVNPSKDSTLAERPLSRHHLKAVENGITSGLSKGCILGFPILGTEIELHDLQVGRGTSLPMITACVAQCIYQAVSKASPVLLEPFMDLEITVDEHKLGVVLSDLSQRHSHIVTINNRQNAHIVMARAALAELRNYSTTLRKITSGLASFSMELSHYEQMSKENEQKTVRVITGLT